MTAGKKLVAVLFLSTLISTPTFLSQGAWAGSKMTMPMNMPMPTTAPKAPTVAKASTPVAPKVATPAKVAPATASYKVAVGVKYSSQKVTLQLKTKVGSKTTKTTIGSFTADNKGFVVIPKLAKPASGAQILVVVSGKQVNSFSASLLKPASASIAEGTIAAPFVAPTVEPTPAPTATPSAAPTPVQTAQPIVPAPVVTPTPTVADALVPQFGTINLTNEGYTIQITNYDPAFTWTATDTSGALVTISKTGLVTVVYNGLPGKVTISTSRTDYKPSSVAAPTVSINGAAAPAAPAPAPAAAAAAPAAAAPAAPAPITTTAPTTDTTTATTSAPAVIAPNFALTVPNKIITIGASITGGYLINTSGGPVTEYRIFPAVPAGTSFDGATGLLSGTPTNQQPATRYQITGINTSGIYQVIYTLTVNALPSVNSGTAPNIIRTGSLNAMRVGGADQVIPAIASSNLPIVYTTSNSAVCEIVTGTSLVRAKAAGDCQVIANQAGNSTYGQANTVTSAVFTILAANDTRWIVVLDPNGGLNNGSSAITWQLVANGSSITLPTGLTNLPGYTTYSWRYDSVANVNTAAHTFIPTADTTLVAKWS